MQCNNPCSRGPANTPACESLPSQIQNFTTQFFGVVVKTEVNGQVVWSLPCSLDIGLPNNPRGVDEGLACYFLRLFRDGIGGLTGPKGATGAPGTNGFNTYTATLQAFGQPTLNSPLTQIVVVSNPSIVDGIGIFVEHSGFYTVTNVAPGGVLFVTLVSPIAGAPAIIPAGSMVIPAGIGPQGVQGVQGVQGIQGAPGFSPTAEHGMYSAVDSSGTPHAGVAAFTVSAASYSVVNFTSEKPEFTPLGAFVYLVNAVVVLWGQGTVTASDLVTLQFRTSDGIVFGQTTVYASGLSNNQLLSVPMTAIIGTTGTPGQTVQIFASTSGAAGSMLIPYPGTYITWARIA